VSRTRQFAVNAATNYGRMLVQIAVFAVLTPYIIGKIGKPDFGLWSTVISWLGLLALLDLGLGTGAMKYVAECHGAGDIEKRNRILSTLAAVYLAITAASVLGVTALAVCFDHLNELTPGEHGKASALLWILAIRFVFLALPLSLFRNALFGEQRIYLINVLQIISTVVYAGGSWLVLFLGYGVVALAWVNLAAMLLEYFGYMWFAYRKMAGLRLAYELVDKRLLKQTASFSSAQFLINVASLVLLKTDTIIASAFFPFKVVAIYALALKVAEQSYLLAKQFTNLLAPLAAQLKGKAEEIKVRFIFVNCTKFAMAPCMLLTVATYVAGSEALAFWFHDPEFKAAGTILMVLLTAMTVGMAELTSSAVLSMTGHHRVTAWAAVAEVFVNVGLSVALVRPLGLVGIAVGTLATSVFIGLGVTVRRACELHGVTYWSYVVRALAPAILPGAVQFALTLALKNWAPPNSLLSTVILCIPGALLYVLLFWSFSIERGEKDLLLSKLLGRFRPVRMAAET